MTAVAASVGSGQRSWLALNCSWLKSSLAGCCRASGMAASVHPTLPPASLSEARPSVQAGGDGLSPLVFFATFCALSLLFNGFSATAFDVSCVMFSSPCASRLSCAWGSVSVTSPSMATRSSGRTSASSTVAWARVSSGCWRASAKATSSARTWPVMRTLACGL